MKIGKRIYIGVIILSLFISMRSRGNQFNRRFINAVKIAKPSVVSIIVYKKIVRGGTAHATRTAYGSGTVAFKNRYIITNLHLLKKGDYYEVVDHTGGEIPVAEFSSGRVYRGDAKTDIAVMQIEPLKNNSINPIEIVNSSTLSEGEWVLAIGNPYGLKQSITSGIVSSKGRDNIGFTDIEDFIQTDVAINPGNSGGPLVNLSGKMVGINTAITTVTGGYQGISFAIPSNIVKRVCYDLIRFGRVRRGWLGFIVQEKNAGRMADRTHVQVISVIRDSPAERAGLRVGDILKEIDGKKVTSNRMLVKYVGNKAIGTKVYLSVSRNGLLKDMQMTLREKHIYHRIRNGLENFFNAYGAEIDENADTGAVVVSYVSPRFLHRGIRKGDIVLSLNRRRVRRIEEFVNVFYESGKSVSTMKVFRDSTIYHIDFINNEYHKGY